MSSHKPCSGYDLRLALVLRAHRGKSARFSRRINDLAPSRVLPGREQDSAQVAQKIRADDPKRVLRDVPGKRGERRRQGERGRRATRVGRQAAALKTVRREVVRIAPTPRRLRLRSPRCLAGRCGARPLTSPDMPVGHEPATTDTARALPEHAHMLYASRGSGGPLLPSRPGSNLESAEAERAHLFEGSTDVTRATPTIATTGCSLFLACCCAPDQNVGCTPPPQQRRSSRSREAPRGRRNSCDPPR